MTTQAEKLKINKLMCPIEMPGVDADTTKQIKDIVLEFEAEHEDDVLNGGDGWVPRMKPWHIGIHMCYLALCTLYIVVTYV